jgi:CubicO group peptidase (beta-lactamase class C family)
MIEEMIEEMLQSYPPLSDRTIGVLCVDEENVKLYSSNKDLPFTMDTPFPLGSCGKSMICYLSARLVDEGLISWDLPIKRAIPEFEGPTEYTTDHLTLRDLLNHKWGIKLYPSNYLVYPDGNYTDDDIIRASKYLVEEKEIRTSFCYSNYTFALSGIVIERWTNQSLSSLLSQYVFGPFEMDKTTVDPPTTRLPFFCTKWGDRISCNFTKQTLLGSSGIFSTMRDVHKWLKGYWTTRNLLPSTEKELTNIQNCNIPIGSQETSWVTGYSFGWKIKNEGPYKVLTHPGESYCSAMKCVVVPELKKAILIIANEYNSVIKEIVNHLSHRLLSLAVYGYDNNSAPLCITESSLYIKESFNCYTNIDNLEGTYSNDILGILEIREIDSSLVPNPFQLSLENRILEVTIKMSPYLRGYIGRYNEKLCIFFIYVNHLEHMWEVTTDRNGSLRTCNFNTVGSRSIWKRINVDSK